MTIFQRSISILSLAPFIGLAMTATVACLPLCGAANTPSPNAPVKPVLWVTGYYTSGNSDTGRYPVCKIDFHALTHIIHFCNFPGPNGTLDPERTITLKQTQEILAPAHAAGCKVIVGLGSDKDLTHFREDIGDHFRPAFVDTLVQFVVARGYDGLDLDYEPVSGADAPNFALFVKALRAAMDAKQAGLLLTVAAADQPAMYAKIQNCFDQINLMSYDLSGLYEDFYTWYNSNLYGNPYERMQNYQPYPSIDNMVIQYLDAGVQRSKLAIGVAFYGYVWSGVSGPKQSFRGLTKDDVDDGADYRDIMDNLYKKSSYHWDSVAHSAYLSIVGKRPKDSKFVSFDDPRTCVEKVKYVWNNGLGGLMIWELGEGYRPNMPAGRRDVMLQTIHRAVEDK